MTPIKVGQVWEAKADGDTPPILCFVGKIDVLKTSDEDMRILSVAVVPHPVAREVGWPIVDHLPVQEAAFLDADLKFVKDGAAVGERFQNGYDRWREKLDVGEVGVFHIAPSDAYAGVVQVVHNTATA